MYESLATPLKYSAMTSEASLVPAEPAAPEEMAQPVEPVREVPCTIPGPAVPEVAIPVQAVPEVAIPPVPAVPAVNPSTAVAASPVHVADTLPVSA